MKARLDIFGLAFLALLGAILLWANPSSSHAIREDAAIKLPAPVSLRITPASPKIAGMAGTTGDALLPQSTPTCTTHTTAMTLTTNSLSPEIGERLHVTVTLANEGCGQVGLLEYRLNLTQPPYTLAPESPLSVTHSIALKPGEVDVALFSLQTIGVGDATLQASASFEVHLGYPGPAYWAYDSTKPLSVSVPATDTEIVVLQQAAYELGYFPKITRGEDAVYQFSCAVAAGHAIDAQIERFTDTATAESVFWDRRGDDTLVEPFRCYPAYSWNYEQESMPQWQDWHTWLAARWIVSTHRVDDTGIPVAPAPLEVSEAVYRAAVRKRLFPACDRIYLPLIRK